MPSPLNYLPITSSQRTLRLADAREKYWVLGNQDLCKTSNWHPKVGCLMSDKDSNDVQHRDRDSEKMAQYRFEAQNTYHHTNPKDHTSHVKQIN